jgi:hypothetical protein
VKFFEKLQQEIQRIAGTHRVAVKVNIDDAGYFDRTCPHEPCGRGFKVLYADSEKFGDDGWCVYCGHKAAGSEFATVAQADHFAAIAHDHAGQLLNDAMRNAAKATTRSTRRYGGKYASVTITETAPVIPQRAMPERIPPEAWAVMRVEAACERCECHFAGVGGCLFCPACGHRSADLTFGDGLRRIRDAFAKKSELEAAIGADHATDIMSKMAESDIQALVTAFEAFAKDSFPRLAPTAPAPPRNVFQNLARGSALWTQHGGRAFVAILTPEEHADLARFFQQRHVLAHNNGIVDEGYRVNTGDTAYEIGQRLAIKAEHALRMADLVEELVAGLRGDLP